MEIDGQATLRAMAAAHPTVGVNAVRPETAERGVLFSNQQRGGKPLFKGDEASPICWGTRPGEVR